MTFQDEFIHRLRVVRGEVTGDGAEDSGRSPAVACGSTGSGRTDERESRHPEFISGPLEDDPEDRGARDGVLKRVQDDDAVPMQGDGGENTRHCEERSDAAIQSAARRPGLLRSARNDEEGTVRGDDAVSGQGDEHTPDKSVRLERSRETGDGGGVSRLRSTRTDGSDGDDNTVRPELVEGQCSDDRRPSTGSGRTESANTPSPNTRHDGWHRDLRVKFLEALAQTGNVQASAYFVQRTRQSAYDLKRRDPDFARAWLAALVLAREEAQDKLQERAIEGVEEEVFYHGEVVATRRRYDSRLLLAHLGRLDKIAAQIPAQRGAARFGDMLDAIGKGEDTAPLIATPTEEELAIAAAEAEARGCPVPEEEEEGEEFYAVSFPYQDGPPDYYRMTPEEAAEMQREVPGLTTTPTGTRDEAVINSLPCHADAMRAFQRDEAEKGMNL